MRYPLRGDPQPRRQKGVVQKIIAVAISQSKLYRFPLKQAYLDILALSAWGILFLYYWLSDQLKLLIHPRFFWAVVAAGIILLVLAGMRAMAIRRPQIAASSPHIRTLPVGWGSMLLLIVAVAGVVIPIQPLGSQAALQEGFGLAELPPLRTQVQRFTGGVRPEERNLSDWARTLAVYPEPDSYQGDPVDVSGFVVYAPELPDGMLMITRFVIRHCAIDAVPIGLPVMLEKPRSAYPQDGWFVVKGEMATVEIGGTRRLAIAPTEIASIPEPDDPYEY
ncbi:MAG: TIGR03943 family protein [Phormidesmis sp.]